MSQQLDSAVPVSADPSPMGTPRAAGPTPAKLAENVRSQNSLQDMFAAASAEQKDSEAKTRSFASLVDQFSLVSRQVENGLYSVKRVASYLKKVCLAEDSYASKVADATMHETGKLERVQGDGMKRSVGAWIGLLEMVHCTANQHQEFRANVMSAVVLPLHAFYKENEAKRKDILNHMKKLKQHINPIIDNVNKTKSKALGSLINLNEAKHMATGEASSPQRKTSDQKSFFNKMSAKVKKLAADSPDAAKEKCMHAIAAFQAAVEVANKERKKYYEHDLPEVFSQLYDLEVARLDVLKEHLTKYALIFHDKVSPLEELSARLVNGVAIMETDDDIHDFVQSWVAVHGHPTQKQPYRYDLPCTADDLRRGRWNGDMELKDHDSIFGSTLPAIMRLQKDKHPQADTPLILTALINAIRRLKGVQILGIFRVSAPKKEVDALHKQLDSGKYEITCTSAHTPAGVLKEWLRELAEPLIPAEVYQQCIDIVKERDMHDVSIEQVMAVYDSLPELNRKVIKELTTFLAEVRAEEAVNKMSVGNLAIVFAPSFLRCESDDPIEMMINSKHEMTFVHVLLRELMQLHGGAAAADTNSDASAPPMATK